MINEFRPMNHLTSLQNLICTIGNLPTSYVLSLSYEEQIWWLCDFLENKVFPAIEENTNITEETQQAFIKLQNYVKDYFNNLDVQEEINNKLDEMAESGELEEIIAHYLTLNSLIVFENVEAMKSATNIINGSKCKTLGYYEKNDGGDAIYLIRNRTFDDVIDNGKLHLINENTVAELIFENEINVKQFGAKGDGITDDTNSIQNAINTFKNVFIPKGEYCISQIILNQYQYLYGAGNKNSIIKSTLDNSNNDIFAIIIPASSNNCNLKDFRTIGGIDIASTGIASVQDVNNIFENVVCENGYGFKVHHRGNHLTNCRSGSTKYGFFVDGTDNNLDNCVSSVTDLHGFAVTNANNSLSNCKAFIAGNKQYGVGFIIVGAFCRVSNCESQQNKYENYFFQNAFSLVCENCLSDGAFWGKENITEYSNPNLNMIIKTNSILLHNLKNCIISISNVNGSVFDNMRSSTFEVLGIPYPSTIHKCNINLTSYNRNNYENIISETDLFRYTSNNSLIINGINYNNFINDVNDIIPKISVSYNANSQEQKTFFTKKLNNNVKKIALNFEKIGDKTKFSSLFWDIMVASSKNGNTNYNNISNQSINENANSFFDIGNFIQSLDFDEIISVALRIIGKNKADIDAFTFDLDNVSIKSTYSEF